jgi:simple sugar transport system ATP-binding protein
MTAAPRPPRVEVAGMTKRFGRLVALADVSLAFEPGTFHAVLGENGAGKSTLVKCVMGYHRPDAGHLVVDGTEQRVATPRQAHALGFGMVYQHFTLVPSMTVAENLVLGDPDLPVILDRPALRARIETFLAGMPFRVDPDRVAGSLAAGEKQKVEILKQLFLGHRLLILDEPTSVLTPEEADRVLGVMREMTAAGRLTVVIITHKFREVMAFADQVTVLRAGRRAGGGQVGDLTRDEMVRMMIGTARVREPAPRRAAPPGASRLRLEAVHVLDDRGRAAVRGVTLEVRSGEIVGVAGVSGNGQRELVEALAGQRALAAGGILADGAPYRRTRAALRRCRVSVLTEEPLASACVRAMTVAENLAFRNFDEPPLAVARWLVSRRAIRTQGRELIERFRIRAEGPDTRVQTLSGGNVQRAALARELSRPVAVLIAQNPCAGLDIAATAEIRSRLMEARNDGAAVLLLSEDLDELLELSDRIVVMFEGRVVHETARESADPHVLGRYMAHD